MRLRPRETRRKDGRRVDLLTIDGEEVAFSVDNAAMLAAMWQVIEHTRIQKWRAAGLDTVIGHDANGPFTARDLRRRYFPDIVTIDGRFDPAMCPRGPRASC